MNQSATQLLQITPAWLNSVLQPVIGAQDAAVTQVHQEQLAGQEQFNADLRRLHLTYDRPHAAVPQSLIAKLPTADAELNTHAAAFQPGSRENWFYRSGASRSPVYVPRCYYTAIDNATGQSILLLEDLTFAPVGSQLTGATLAQTRLALASLARLHGRWWDDTASEEIQELTRLIADKWVAEQNLVGELYATAWPKFLEQRLVEIPDEVRHFGAAIVGNMKLIDALIDRAPKTLAHGDYRLENIHFGVRDGEAICWIIDWEDVFFGAGMVDVSWFLGGCLPVEQSHHETELLRQYYQTLMDEGVENYSWAQCYDDYRCGMCSSFVQGVLSATLAEGANEQAYKLAQVVASRFIAAAQRLRLSEMLSA